jgi:acyl CoA:acetate/3-ketoacid CoA transferase beta subunit
VQIQRNVKQNAMMDYKRKEGKKNSETNTQKIDKCILLSNSVVYMAVTDLAYLQTHKDTLHIYMLDCFHVPLTKTIIQYINVQGLDKK